MKGKRRGSHRGEQESSQLPVRAEDVPRSQQRRRWTGGRPGRGLYLPIAEELGEQDMPLLLANAERQMRRAKRRMGIYSP